MAEGGYSIYFENREAKFRQICQNGQGQQGETALFTDISRIPVPPIILIKCWFVLSLLALIAAILSVAMGVFWIYFFAFFIVCEVGYLIFVWRVVLTFGRKIQALCLLAELRDFCQYQVFLHHCEAIRGHFYVKIVVEPCPFEITPEIQRLLENLSVEAITQKDLYPSLQFHRDPVSGISEPLHLMPSTRSFDEFAECRFRSYEEYHANVVAELPALKKKKKKYKTRVERFGSRFSPPEISHSLSSSHIISYPPGLSSASPRLIDRLLCLE